MGLDDKAKNKAQELNEQAKVTAGRALGRLLVPRLSALAACQPLTLCTTQNTRKHPNITSDEALSRRNRRITLPQISPAVLR